MNSDQAYDTQCYNFLYDVIYTIPWTTQIDLVNDIVVVFRSYFLGDFDLGTKISMYYSFNGRVVHIWCSK